MQRKTVWFVGVAMAVAAIGIGTGAAGASQQSSAAEEHDVEAPLTGSALEQASAAALAYTGGGTIIESEVGDEGSAYGVEIRLDDGRVVEVGLDKDFAVIGLEADDDGAMDAQGDD